jgi:hypothetical protein
MPRITVQNGRLVIRENKVGTEQACCCGGCCECACPGGFQVRVNGNVINTTACDFYGPEGWKYPHALGPYATFGLVTVSPPTDYLYGCDELFYPNGDAPGYDYDNPDFWPDFSAYFGSAKYCLKCVNNRLILSLGLYISYPWSTASYSLYDAFYEVQGTCPEALSVTLTEPIIGGELVTPNGGPTFVPRGVVRNGIIYREGDWYDANGALPICPRPAEFDPSQLTVEIECHNIPHTFHALAGQGLKQDTTAPWGSARRICPGYTTRRLAASLLEERGTQMSDAKTTRALTTHSHDYRTPCIV